MRKRKTKEKKKTARGGVKKPDGQKDTKEALPQRRVKGRLHQIPVPKRAGNYDSPKIHFKDDRQNKPEEGKE